MFPCLLSSLSYLYFQLKDRSIAHDWFRNVGEIRALNVQGLCSNSEVVWIILVFTAFFSQEVMMTAEGNVMKPRNKPNLPPSADGFSILK